MALRVLGRILEKYPTVISGCSDPIAFTDKLLTGAHLQPVFIAPVMTSLATVCPSAVSHFLHRIVDPWVEAIINSQFDDAFATALCTIIQFSSIDDQPQWDVLLGILTAILVSLESSVQQIGAEAVLP
jgi:hypothetical protein